MDATPAAGPRTRLTDPTAPWARSWWSTRPSSVPNQAPDFGEALVALENVALILGEVGHDHVRVPHGRVLAEPLRHRLDAAVDARAGVEAAVAGRDQGARHSLGVEVVGADMDVAPDGQRSGRSTVRRSPFDGSTIALEDPNAALALSRWLTSDVGLARPRPGEQLAYQMTFDPPNDDAEYFDVPSPEGCFVDLAPLHLVTTATLAGCATARPDLSWDIRRFRPNLVIDLDSEAFCGDRWSGQAIQVGPQVVLEVVQPTMRGAVPLSVQPGSMLSTSSTPCSPTTSVSTPGSGPQARSQSPTQ
jgi:hypothetical protein